MSKAKTALDDSIRDVAPGTELRKWFATIRGRWGNSSTAIGAMTIDGQAGGRRVRRPISCLATLSKLLVAFFCHYVNLCDEEARSAPRQLRLL